MTARLKLVVLSGAALAAAAAGVAVFASWGDAPAPAPVPLEQAAPAVADATRTDLPAHKGDDCCSGHGDGRSHTACPMKASRSGAAAQAPAPPPVVAGDPAKCPYLARTRAPRAGEKGGPQ